MKRLLFFLLLMPLLTACPPGKDSGEDIVKNFRKNGYNMLPVKKHGYKKITFKLPESMEMDYSSHYTYKSDAYRYREHNIGIIFSIERFTEDDLYSTMMEDFIIEDDLLNSFHDAYVDRRLGSLHEGGASFKKDVRKNVKFPGTIQVVSGQSSSGSELLYYATATLKVEKEYYLFQFICDKPMMDYVYDDFERILASVRKK